MLLVSYLSMIWLSNISPFRGTFEHDFPFPVWWDMLVPWRVRPFFARWHFKPWIQEAAEAAAKPEARWVVFHTGWPLAIVLYIRWLSSRTFAPKNLGAEKRWDVLNWYPQNLYSKINGCFRWIFLFGARTSFRGELWNFRDVRGLYRSIHEPSIKTVVPYCGWKKSGKPPDMYETLQIEGWTTVFHQQ